MTSVRRQRNGGCVRSSSCVLYADKRNKNIFCCAFFVNYAPSSFHHRLPLSKHTKHCVDNDCRAKEEEEAEKIAHFA